MSCPESEKAKLYLSGSLSTKQEDSFQNHIENCPDCREQVENLLKHDTFLKELQSEYNQTYRHDASSARDITISNFFLSGLGGTKIDFEFSPGQQLADRYRIIRKLGQKYTNVYHAFDMHLGHEVAIKLVATGPDRSGKAFSQLRQELLFRNPINDFTNVIKTYDIHPVEYEGISLILLTMEYADGGSLRNWLNESRLNANNRIAEGAGFITQACSAVKIIHSVDLIHRDIKPENILLCRNDDDFIVKLSDFGISYSLADISPDLEQTPVIAGTPLYMAPEQFVSDNQSIIGTTSDIYSLGIVIYEILTGKPPFYGNFKQLREKHLHQQPPKLSGDLHKWGQIVERCLKKDPASRYGNINELINDIERLKKGLAISIDISCPQCGHVNLNVNATECENCYKRLDSVFHPCPVCGKHVRFDVEYCPGCGKNVASYYILMERQQQIESLKDEDAVEAIKLLELVLKEGAGDFHNRAIELVKELRNKQLKVNSLVEQATKATAKGNSEKAIGFWNDILQIIPRHKAAKQQLQRLRSLNTKFGNQWKEAVVSMNNGKFEEAEKLFENCLKIIPNHNDIIILLQDCRARALLYNKALENATISNDSKRLLRAKKQIKIALEQAPKSQKAIKLHSSINSKLKTVKALCDKYVDQFNRAIFNGMAGSINEIEQIQSDSPRFSDSAKRDIFRSQDKYLKLINDAHDAIEAKQLEKATNKIHAALKICSNSVKAKKILALVDRDRSKAQSLVEKARSEILSARFSHAQQLLEDAMSISLSMRGIHATCKTLLEVQNIYNCSMAEAEEFLKNRDIKKALEAATSALKVCSDSKHTSKLIKSIKANQSQSRKYLEEAKEFLRLASFDKAWQRIEETRNLWSTFELLANVEAETQKTADSFNTEMTQAKQYLKQGNLQESLEAFRRALEICPGSEEASAMVRSIQTDQLYAQEHFEEARELLKSASFDKAMQKIEEARSLWPTFEPLVDMEKQIEQISNSFQTEMATARKYIDNGLLDESIIACRQALCICPRSEEAISLEKWLIAKISDIDTAVRRERDKRNKRNIILKIIFSPIYLPYLTVLLSIPYIAKHWKVFVISAIIVVIVGIIGYGAFAALKWIFSHPRTVIATFVAFLVAAAIIIAEIRG